MAMHDCWQEQFKSKLHADWRNWREEKFSLVDSNGAREGGWVEFNHSNISEDAWWHLFPSTLGTKVLINLDLRTHRSSPIHATFLATNLAVVWIWRIQRSWIRSGSIAQNEQFTVWKYGWHARSISISTFPYRHGNYGPIEEGDAWVWLGRH